MEYKILCTGNPEVVGIAKAIKELFPTTVFLSRTTGYDFSTQNGIDKFSQIIKDYNVFINHSQLPVTVQEQLLRITRSKWESGHVINIGSVLEFKNWEWIDPVCAEDKRNLREASLSLCDEDFKSTHMILGSFQDRSDPDPEKLNCEKIASTIKWILESEMHVPLIYVDKIKNEKIEYWKSLKQNSR